MGVLWAVVSACADLETAPAPVAPAPSAGVRPDVVLLTLDTCRADRLGAYGYADADTPHLDALAARGRRYARAWSPAPLTLPAHGAIFTGRYPSSLGLWTNGAGLPGGVTTLAERFRGAGYATAASVGAFLVGRGWGFDRGFDAYFDTGSGDRVERPGSDVVDDIVRWKDGATSAPRFAWVHLYDAHEPHTAPVGVEARPDPYDAEIAGLDLQVGRLVAAFSDRPTVFVVVGDHGEALGEHGERDHSLYVYDATQRVPWLVAGPGVAPAVVEEPVSLVDVAPTLLDLLALPPVDGAEGRVAPGAPAAPVFMESWALQLRFGLAPHRAVVDGSYKLIDLPTPELYRLETDPQERDNIAEADPARVARLAALVRGRANLAERPPSSTSVEAAALLARLGYVEGEEGLDAGGPLPDPKDHASLVNAVERADALVAAGAIPEAYARLSEVAGAYPDVRELRVRRAELLSTMGRPAEALALLDEGAVRDPDSAVLKEARAAVLLALGRPDEAAAMLVELAATEPHQPGEDARAFAALLRTSGGAARAVEYGLSALERAPQDPELAGLVGVELMRLGQRDRARPLLAIGSRGEPPVRDVSFFLARLAHEGGDVPGARRHLETELAAHGNNTAAVLALALVLGQLGDWDAQLALMERVLSQVDAAGGAVPGFDVAVLWAFRAKAERELGRAEDARRSVQRGLSLNPRQPDLLGLKATLGLP